MRRSCEINNSLYFDTLPGKESERWLLMMNKLFHAVRRAVNVRAAVFTVCSVNCKQECLIFMSDVVQGLIMVW